MIAVRCRQYQQLKIGIMHMVTPLETLVAWVVMSVPVGLLVGMCMARQEKNAVQRAHPTDKRQSVHARVGTETTLPADACRDIGVLAF